MFVSLGLGFSSNILLCPWPTFSSWAANQRGLGIESTGDPPMRMRRAVVALVLGAAISAIGSQAAMAGPVAAGFPHVVGTVRVGDGPSGVAANPRTGRVYVADFRDDTVTALDQVSKRRTLIPVGSGPAAVGINA